MAIYRELAGMGVTPDEVASTFVVMAAAMLVEACGGKAGASALAARLTRVPVLFKTSVCDQYRKMFPWFVVLCVHPLGSQTETA